VSPEGQRFLALKRAAPSTTAGLRSQLIVGLNWFEELKRLAPTR
jgi:hypothetical protein